MPKKKEEETKQEKPLEEKESIVVIKSSFASERVLAELNNESRNLYDTSRFGEPFGDKIQYSLVEALYLLEKGKLNVLTSKNKELTYDGFIKLATELEPKFWVRYCVYRDMRSRG